MRGTNPCIRFTMPFAQTMVAKTRLSVRCEEKMLFSKDTADMYWQEALLCIPLTRQDTLLLPDDSWVQLQLQVETTGGDYLVAAPQWLYTGILLNEEAPQ